MRSENRAMLVDAFEMSFCRGKGFLHGRVSGLQAVALFSNPKSRDRLVILGVDGRILEGEQVAQGGIK